MSKDKKWGLTETQRDYILKNHRKISLKKIADNLNIPSAKVYYFSRKIKLKKKRDWSKKENQYLTDQIGIKTVRMIARELQRTESAIYSQCYELGIKITEDDKISGGIQLKPLCKKTGVPSQAAYADVRNGKLKSYGRAMYGRKHYILDLEDINSWVAWKFPLKEFSCYECGTKTMASILCDEHLPKEFKKTFIGKTKHFIEHSGSGCKPDLTDKMIEKAREIRELENVSQKTISEKACFYTQWCANIENRHKHAITIEDLERIFDVLGYEIEIKLTRTKKREL